MIRFLQKNKYQILKFIIVGLISNVLNFGVYTLVYKLTFSINLASFLGYVVGLVNSFLFSKNWVFNNSKKLKLDKTFIIFTLIYFLGGLEMTIIINTVNENIQDYRLAWICGAIVAAINNYLGSKYLLFEN